jgi:hypothetical protein
MIASNLPDIDVLVFATSTPSVAFRLAGRTAFWRIWFYRSC